MEHEIEDEEVGKMGGCHSSWSTSIMGPQCLPSHMLSVDLRLSLSKRQAAGRHVFEASE